MQNRHETELNTASIGVSLVEISELKRTFLHHIQCDLLISEEQCNQEKKQLLGYIKNREKAASTTRTQKMAYKHSPLHCVFLFNPPALTSTNPEPAPKRRRLGL